MYDFLCMIDEIINFDKVIILLVCVVLTGAFCSEIGPISAKKKWLGSAFQEISPVSRLRH